MVLDTEKRNVAQECELRYWEALLKMSEQSEPTVNAKPKYWNKIAF